jgi:hypothetical protein
MSQRTNELMSALARASRAGDDGAFDMALGDLLARARRGAESDAATRVLVAERLSSALAASPLAPISNRAPEGASAGLVPSSGSSGSGAQRVPSSPALRGVRTAGLVVAGVALGFFWGREHARTAEDGARDAGRAGTGSVERNGEAWPAAPGIAPAAQPTSTTGGALTDTVPSEAAPVVAVPRAPRSNKSKSQPSNADSLRFAIEQLRKAQLFSRAGEPARALRELDVLDSRVPIEVLREEREVARTLAWCDAGQVAKAKALASSLLERAPDSAYGASLRESCAAQGLTEPPINFQLLEQMRQSTSNSMR